jgi:four helix bundle protein
MKDFKQLAVWKKSHDLTLAIYKASAVFPKSEIYGLTSQIRRASASIPANIAEGCGRSGDPELARFLQIAMGSASELEYHLLLARELGFMDAATFENLDTQTTSIKKMLTSFIQKLNADRRQPIASSLRKARK